MKIIMKGKHYIILLYHIKITQSTDSAVYRIFSNIYKVKIEVGRNMYLYNNQCAEQAHYVIYSNLLPLTVGPRYNVPYTYNEQSNI